LLGSAEKESDVTDPKRTGAAQIIVPMLIGALVTAVWFGVLAWAW
jgi:hypothetical protein